MNSRIKVLSALCACALAFSFAACGKRGGAEKAGEKVDNVFRKDGPAENAGEKVDDALHGK
jgi:hypothetical protein